MRKTTWLAGAFGVSMLLFALPSKAAATEGALQLGIGFRYGKDLDNSDLNRWGTGIGFEAGYTLPLIPVYIGGNAEYFFGGSLNSPGGKIDANVWQLSAEGGYDFGLGDHLVLRPKLGLGMAHLSGSSCLSNLCQDSSDTKPLLAPGAKLLLLLSHFQMSFDARYAVVTSDPTAKAFIFSVGIGF